MVKFRSQNFGGVPGRKKEPLSQQARAKIKNEKQEKLYDIFHLRLRKDVAAAFRIYCVKNERKLKDVLEECIYEQLLRPALLEQMGEDIPYQKSVYNLDYDKTVKAKNKYLEGI